LARQKGQTNRKLFWEAGGPAKARNLSENRRACVTTCRSRAQSRGSLCHSRTPIGTGRELTGAPCLHRRSRGTTWVEQEGAKPSRLHLPAEPAKRAQWIYRLLQQDSPRRGQLRISQDTVLGIWDLHRRFGRPLIEEAAIRKLTESRASVGPSYQMSTYAGSQPRRSEHRSRRPRTPRYCV
jgi:hypothetical protein